MTTINLIDIIKSSPCTKTIWQQDLNRTEDYHTLRTLLDAYVSVAMENLHTERNTCYKSFYDDVLWRFEENS
jgi:hypothetical protein